MGPDGIFQVRISAVRTGNNGDSVRQFVFEMTPSPYRDSTMTLLQGNEDFFQCVLPKRWTRVVVTVDPRRRLIDIPPNGSCGGFIGSAIAALIWAGVDDSLGSDDEGAISKAAYALAVASMAMVEARLSLEHPNPRAVLDRAVAATAGHIEDVLEPP